jgi:hypothetical protein
MRIVRSTLNVVCKLTNIIAVNKGNPSFHGHGRALTATATSIISVQLLSAQSEKNAYKELQMSSGHWPSSGRVYALSILLYIIVKKKRGG